MIEIKGIPVKGLLVDEETRCHHYQTERDIIAIKFKCCGDYYPCHLCHEESTDHPAVQWDIEERDVKAILCGHCGTELSIQAYMDSGSVCPTCHSLFNPGCERHYPLYFK